MTRYVALLRAVNVGGTGKLPMSELKAMCEAAGFQNVQTYIASGNAVFSSKLSEAQVKAELERRLHAYAGKPVGVMVRTAAEIEAVVKANPFAGAAGNLTVAIFLDDKPPADAIAKARNRRNEQIEAGSREIYAFYPTGQGQSRLIIPAAKEGTARNMNTVAKLATLAAA